MIKIIIGIGLTLIGISITNNSDKLFSTFGRIALVEKYLGSEGGSRLFYQLLGIIMVLIGLILITGLDKLIIEGLTFKELKLN